MLGFAGLGGTATKAELTYTLETKAAGQMSGRGWSNDLISNAINQPTRTVITRDTRWDPAINARRDDPATAYYATDGSYVVRNDVNGTVVQVSDKFKPTWKAPWEK
nr:colicin E5-related ribonuclease [Paenarthrobacter sp. MSM-2-10-13]